MQPAASGAPHPLRHPRPVTQPAASGAPHPLRHPRPVTQPAAAPGLAILA
jgi:hypothetical protein